MPSNVQSMIVTGAAGMFGRVLVGAARAAGIDVRPVARDACDITDAADVRRMLAGAAPGTVVVNAAAWTDVDGAEDQEDAADRVNHLGPAVLAEACRAADARLVHISTDYVFRGDGTAPYGPDDPIDPINAYGRTKARGEDAIRAAGGRFLILRTAWLYDAGGACFLTTIDRLAAERDRLEVVDDQRGRPTTCRELARQLLALVAADATGTFHCCCEGEGTWYDFASAIVAGRGHDCTVAPCDSSRYPRPAARPAYSVLDLAETTARIGPAVDWRADLAAELLRLEPRSSEATTRAPA